MISVGATDEDGTAAPSDDTLADFSSRGVTQDGIAKPDVLAPGAHIVSTLAAGSDVLRAVPGVRRRRRVLQDGRHLDGRPGRRRRRRAGPAGPPGPNPDQVKALLVDAANTTSDGRPRSATSAEAVAANPGRGRQPGRRAERRVAAALAAAGAGPDPRHLDQGDLDARPRWTKATWTKATWTKASWTGGVAAPWARATWTCDGCDADTTAAADDSASLTKSTWSKSTWSKSTWSKSSWSSVPEW